MSESTQTVWTTPLYFALFTLAVVLLLTAGYEMGKRSQPCSFGDLDDKFEEIQGEFNYTEERVNALVPVILGNRDALRRADLLEIKHSGYSD